MAGVSEVVHPYIERDSSVLGGEPAIRGTRIGVRHIVEWQRLGMSVDEIITMYPHLNHAKVHDALSYYFDHRVEVDGLIEQNTDLSIRTRFADRPWLNKAIP